MNLDEIVNKAIPLSFPGVKCGVTERLEIQKAKVRRAKLKEDIVTLLDARDTTQLRVDEREY